MSDHPHEPSVDADSRSPEVPGEDTAERNQSVTEPETPFLPDPNRKVATTQAPPPDPDEDLTSEDHTPYAIAKEDGGVGWFGMSKWIMFANRQRLMHLGLSRPSSASRRFGLLAGLLLAVFVTATTFVNSALMVSVRQPNDGGIATAPQGEGWVRVIEETAVPATVNQRTPVALWWNFPLAAIRASTAGIATLLLCWMALFNVAARGAKALQPPFADSPRLRCAVHYSSAWVVLLVLAALVWLPRPIVDYAWVADWATVPHSYMFDVPAVLLVLAGVLSWWFWLVRLAGTTPPATRGSVSSFFMFRAAVWVLVLIGGGAAGVLYLLSQLDDWFKLAW